LDMNGGHVGSRCDMILSACGCRKIE
jgi:hypothetical protein